MNLPGRYGKLHSGCLVQPGAVTCLASGRPTLPEPACGPCRRVRRLFRRVRRHERVQVEAYIRLLGADRAALAECFTGPGGSMDVLVHWVDRDDSLWEEQVLPSLRNAVMDVRARVRSTL